MWCASEDEERERGDGLATRALVNLKAAADTSDLI